MVKPVDPTRVVEYVHPSDREGGKPDGAPIDGATVWRIRGLTKRQRAALLDVSIGTPGGPARGGLSQHRTVRWGLTGVDHFDVPFATEADAESVGGKAPTDAFLDTIPDEVFRDLAHAITRLSKLTEDDAGKSSRSPT